MDHVESPPDSPYPLLEVPCLSDEPYEHHDFSTYPEHKGWDINRLFDGDFTEHEEAAPFLQNWLFFGVLWEVFGPINKGGKHHYIKQQGGHPYGTITVVGLEERILELTSFISALIGGGEKATADHIGHRIEQCLQTVSRLCRIAKCDGDPRPGFTTWPLSPEIDLSIRTLSQRLAWSFATGVMPLVFDSYTGGLEFPCAWLPLKRLQDSGWCPSEVAMVEETFTSASAYYTSQLESPPSATQKDHSQCTRSLCMARQLNEETYRTAHTTPDCDCSHHGPLINEVTSILESGGIPLLSITPIKKEPHIRVAVEKYTEGKKYIAFSHVWSDGLGNPSQNTLPQCQLLRIQSLLDELVSGIRSVDLVNRLAFRELWKKKFHGPSLLFWMDTMCIPVADEHRELRSKAIKSMKAVYERAFRVLVLDGDIQSFSSSDYTQSFMRIRLSAWMRRLWTLNEGVLAHKLRVKFADGFFDVQARSKIQQDEAYDSELEQTKYTYGTPMRDADNFHWKFRLLRINVISEPDPRMVRKTTSDSASTPPEAKRCFAIMEAFSAALYRSTSKERDEMLCFASLIGWDISLLKGLPFEDHMHALLSTEKQLPQGMLFLAGPRMRQRGWRWAINRFGNCGAKRLKVKSDDMTMGFVTDNGFVVEYPALVLPLNCTLEKLDCLAVDVDVGNGFVGTFQITRHDEGLGDAEGKAEAYEHDHGQLHVLYWDMTKKMPPRSPMPAAVVSSPAGKGLAEGEMVYRFECLACVEILKMRPGKLQERGNELAQLVEGKWTIQ
ncbi:uncharacterized protein DSM5745_05829 [Aspergillus mulundensis]|uniref:Heterokaryon incompatibility domain-containing protein n=1 Tax=Aspergillus mulundensis TaxID=1810919 RepID=A0A3D8RY36_9EURO|nr:hypothetical protein DSM5745_05829 [Aspergillus mulundensis]RDW78977.1 hypothetical protein DSM5745_05829 [Aspergillus mulundensis]